MTTSESSITTKPNRWLVPAFRVQMQRNSGSPGSGQNVALHVERLARRVWIDSHEVRLSSQKFDLLCYFLDHAGEAINASQLVKANVLRPSQGMRYKNLISELRAALKRLCALFEAVPGYGYRCVARPISGTARTPRRPAAAAPAAAAPGD
jgi:DNA-binding response OmpR family regulator